MRQTDSKKLRLLFKKWELMTGYAVHKRYWKRWNGEVGLHHIDITLTSHILQKILSML